MPIRRNTKTIGMIEIKDILTIINLGYRLQYCTLMPTPACAQTKHFDYDLQFHRRKENGLRDTLRMTLNTFKPIDKEVNSIIELQ